MPTGSPTSRASSSTAATTWCAPFRTRGSSRRRGPRPSSSSRPPPGIRRSRRRPLRPWSKRPTASREGSPHRPPDRPFEFPTRIWTRSWSEVIRKLPCDRLSGARTRPARAQAPSPAAHLGGSRLTWQLKLGRTEALDAALQRHRRRDFLPLGIDLEVLEAARLDQDPRLQGADEAVVVLHGPVERLAQRQDVGPHGGEARVELLAGADHLL